MSDTNKKRARVILAIAMGLVTFAATSLVTMRRRVVDLLQVDRTAGPMSNDGASAGQPEWHVRGRAHPVGEQRAQTNREEELLA